MSTHQPPVRSVTTAQLTRAGLTSRQIDAFVRSGKLERIGRGVYVQSLDVDAASPESRVREHLVRAVALCRSSSGAYLVGPSACLALGLPLLVLPRDVHIARASSRVQTRRLGLRAHRPWSHDIRTLDDLGVDVQCPEAAIVELAAREGALHGLVPADVAARHEDVRFERVLASWGKRHGIAQARLVAELADGRRESPLETQTAWQAHGEGIRLEPQTVIRDRAGEWVATVDFTVAGYKVVVEVDGLGKYRRPDDLKKERVRHNQIEELGWLVVRVIADDLRFGRFVPRLQAAMARAERR